MIAQATASSAELIPFGKPRFHRWLASRVGHYQLRRILKGGLPPSLLPPFLFLLNGRVNPEDYQVIREIEALRAALAKRENEFVDIFSHKTSIQPAKRDLPSADAQPLKTTVRSLTQVAQISSVIPHWGTCLHLCANATQAKTILELGSSAGISGCYMASGTYCHKFITVEGSPSLAKLAKTHLSRLANNFEVLNASFDEALDTILPTLQGGIDMAYIDGGKDKLSNLHYFDRLTPYLNTGSVVVLDDIYWSSEMWEAWETLSQWTGLFCSINAGRCGVCVWSGGTPRPKTYALYSIAGVDLYDIKLRLERAKTWLLNGRSQCLGIVDRAP